MSWQSKLTGFAYGAESLLRSNKAINSVYGMVDNVASGLTGRAAGELSEHFAQSGMTMGKLAEQGTAQNAANLRQKLMSEANYTGKDAVRFGLATYAAGSIGARALSGGGVYRDSKGNFDIAGIPIL